MTNSTARSHLSKVYGQHLLDTLQSHLDNVNPTGILDKDEEDEDVEEEEVLQNVDVGSPTLISPVQGTSTHADSQRATGKKEKEEAKDTIDQTEGDGETASQKAFTEPQLEATSSQNGAESTATDAGGGRGDSGSQRSVAMEEPSVEDASDLKSASIKHGNDDDGLQNGSPAVEESPPGPSIDGQMDAESSDATVIDMSHSAQENVKEEDNARRSIKTDKSKNSNTAAGQPHSEESKGETEDTKLSNAQSVNDLGKGNSQDANDPGEDSREAAAAADVQRKS